MDIIINDTIDSNSERIVGTILNEYNWENSPATKENRSIPLEILLRDENGEIIGGIYGRTFWGCMEIKMLAIHANYRKQGMGIQLMQAAEEEAKKRNCLYITLDTFSFQARGFYEKFGFDKVGTETNFPQGHEKYYYRKVIQL